MSIEDHAWLLYFYLQQRSKKLQNLNDYAWGVESGLNYLLKAIETGTLPSNLADLEASLNRAIASGARLRRSRSSTLKRWMKPPESSPIDAAAEAIIGLAQIGCTLDGDDAKIIEPAPVGCVVKENEARILLDAGRGYTDRELAHRHTSMAGAIRVRLSRLRCKLAAKGRGRMGRPMGTYSISGNPPPYSDGVNGRPMKSERRN